MLRPRRRPRRYRLDPKQFLAGHNLPELPFAVFMILGMDFTGFHVRFRDISRGGVRLIKSTSDSYNVNRATQFQASFVLLLLPDCGDACLLLMQCCLLVFLDDSQWIVTD